MGLFCINRRPAMSYISKIDLPTAPQEVCAAVDNHLAQGYQLTNEKLTLLHNVTAFHTLEEAPMSWTVSCSG